MMSLEVQVRWHMLGVCSTHHARQVVNDDEGMAPAVAHTFADSNCTGDCCIALAQAGALWSRHHCCVCQCILKLEQRHRGRDIIHTAVKTSLETGASSKTPKS